MHKAPRLRGGALARFAALIVGLYAFGYGTVVLLDARLGLSPWDVLHQGIAKHTPLDFGEAVIAVGVVILVGAIALGVYPGVGTILNALLVGAFVDVTIHLGIAPRPSGIPLRLLADVGGVAIIGVATAIYIGAGMGAGPRDGFMLALTTRLGVRIGVARTGLELGALAAGVALGGSVGVGTALFAFGIGPAVEVGFWLLVHSPAAERSSADPPRAAAAQERQGAL